MQKKPWIVNLLWQVLYEISLLLNCKLDPQSHLLLVSLCECGINPEALALAVKELQT